jgi:hypothetical protein
MASGCSVRGPSWRGVGRRAAITRSVTRRGGLYGPRQRPAECCARREAERIVVGYKRREKKRGDASKAFNLCVLVFRTRIWKVIPS